MAEATRTAGSRGTYLQSALLLQRAELVLQRHARRHEISEGLGFVLRHDAKFLTRLEDGLLTRIEDALQVINQYAVQVRDVGWRRPSLSLQTAVMSSEV